MVWAEITVLVKVLVEEVVETPPRIYKCCCCCCLFVFLLLFFVVFCFFVGVGDSVDRDYGVGEGFG